MCAVTELTLHLTRTHCRYCGCKHSVYWFWNRVANVTSYKKALPVLLHPSDGFVLVKLSLKFVLLQSEHRHAALCLHTVTESIRNSAELFLFSVFPRNPPLASLVLLPGPLAVVREQLGGRCTFLLYRLLSLRPLPHRAAPRVLTPTCSGSSNSKIQSVQFIHFMLKQLIQFF